jgi:hypothetical protein
VPPALGVRVGLDARDQLRRASLRDRPALGVKPPRHPGGRRIGQEPIGHHHHARRQPVPPAPPGGAKTLFPRRQQPRTPPQQQRATAAAGGSEHGAAALGANRDERVEVGRIP